MKFLGEVRSGNKDLKDFHIEMVFKSVRTNKSSLGEKAYLTREKGTVEGLPELQCLHSELRRN